jgi:hypothetical protein
MARPATPVVFLSALALLALAAPASASSPSASAPAAAAPLAAPSPVAGTVGVDLKVTRFIAQRRRTRAVGVVTATLSSFTGSPTTARQRVVLQVAQGRTCRILLLTLNQLNLQLLGVTVHLDRVRLSITGRRNGGVLGSLFCSLAGRRLTAARSAAVASLNRGLRARPMHVMAFRVPARAAQATGACTILDLVLGPLHLELLGLIVDLNRVHLSITGDPNAGILGRLLCGLNGATVTPAA